MGVNSAKAIFVAGHRGMVGSALVKRLQASGERIIITRSREQLDLTRQSEVESFFAEVSVNEVYLAAARVGGILANNSQPADFVYQNLMIEANVIHAAFKAGVQSLLFLGSSCIYPRDADQPMSEEALLSGPLELSNEPYAVAKIAGIKLCESYNRQHGMDFRSVMPTNLYGPDDNFNLDTSHVMAALLRKFHQACLDDLESVQVWGSGRPKREFLHVDDLASACEFVMGLPCETYRAATDSRCSHINVGCGTDVSISELAEMIARVVGYEGRISYDASKPDGTPRKLLDVSRMDGLGWSARIPLEDGIRSTWRWMVEHWDRVSAS